MLPIIICTISLTFKTMRYYLPSYAYSILLSQTGIYLFIRNRTRIWFKNMIVSRVVMRGLDEGRCSGGAELAPLKSHRARNVAQPESEQPTESGAEILATAGHDLRGSVSTMLVLGEVLLEEAGARMSESERSVLAGILTSGEVALQLAEDVLDLSAAAGLMKLSLEPVDLISAISQSISLQKPISDQKKVQLLLHAEQTPPIMMLDWMKIVRAFSKLFSYAISCSVAEDTIDIRVTCSERFARIGVQDQRPENPPEDLVKASPFPPSECACNRLKCEPERNLAIAKGIVKAHGGRIQVNNKAGFSGKLLLMLPLTSASNRTHPIH